MQRGDVFVLNAPYNGGTHLPDVTVIAPVFLGRSATGAASSTSPRAAITRTSAASRRARCRPIRRTSTRRACCSTTCSSSRQGASSKRRCARSSAPAAIPSRNVDQNLADLRAQVAACAKGAAELAKMVAHFGLPVVRAYMQHVQDNAEEAVRRVLDVLKDGALRVRDGQRRAHRRDDRRSTSARREATIDFTGTSAQQPTNFNAPSAVCKAAVLYVFRTLVDDEIPMNAGCLKPLRIVIPEGSMLEPALSGGGRRRQRRDLAGDHRHAVRRARRARRVAGHDEQLHVRQRRRTSTTRRSPAAPAPGPTSTARAPCRRT